MATAASPVLRPAGVQRRRPAGTRLRHPRGQLRLVGDRRRLTLTVNNGMGEGIDAALLTNLAVNALRNARRAG